MLVSNLLVGVAVLASAVSAQTPYHLGLHLVKSISATVTKSGSGFSSSATAEFTVTNPAPTFEVQITEIAAQVGKNGVVYGTFDNKFSSFVLNKSGTTSSGSFPIKLTPAAVNKPSLLSETTFDLITANVSISVFSIKYPIPLNFIFQKNIPIKFTVKG